MRNRRVVVTGIGALTPLGNNLQDYWHSLKSGVSGADNITHFDASNFKTQFACELKDFNITDFIDRKEARKMDKFSQYALVVADEAIKSSELDVNSINSDRAGVIWGSGIGGMETFFKESSGFATGSGLPRFSPFFIPKLISDIPAGHISIKYKFRGPNFTTVSACASSTNAIIDAFNYIKLNKADIFIAGGSEACIFEPGIGGFNAMMALSTRNEDPKTASRPFDKDRDGFVMGEGAGVLVLEEYEHALARGAKIYAEILGYGLSGDAHHITAPASDGNGGYRSMKAAIKRAGLEPSAIDYINAHGTSTMADTIELGAVERLLGSKSGNATMSSTKSAIGHLLGAAGAVEAIFSILAIRDQIAPPTLNLLDPVPSVLNLAPLEAVEREINVVLSNSFGFGGTNASLVMGKAI